MTITITTDNKSRAFIPWQEVPEEVYKKAVDDFGEEEAQCDFSYIHYNGMWIHLREFDRRIIDYAGPMGGWAGVIGNDAWSGILVRFDQSDLNDERYQIGTYTVTKDGP